MIIVKEVKSKKEQKEFLNFPLKMYKNNPYFVPPIYLDEKKIFNKNYMYLDQSEAKYFNAYKDGVMVGRISAILQKAANKKYNQNRVRFTRFDSIDDQNVANALFDAVTNYAKEKNMDTLVGPLGFSDLEREGLLVEGFEELSTFEEQYNFDYYEKLITNYGFNMEVEWVEQKVYKAKDIERLTKYSQKILDRFKLHRVKCKSVNELVDKYALKIFDILDITYDNIYQTVPFTDSMKKLMISNFKLILDLRYVHLIADENDNLVCFGLAFPGIAKALQKSSGHLTIPTIFKLLKTLKNPEILDFALVGVLPEYYGRGISSILFGLIAEQFEGNNNIKWGETNLCLVTNTPILSQWRNFETDFHKKRRSYTKAI